MFGLPSAPKPSRETSPHRDALQAELSAMLAGASVPPFVAAMLPAFVAGLTPAQARNACVAVVAAGHALLARIEATSGEAAADELDSAALILADARAAE